MGSREELLSQGFTVARGILPPQLVARLLAVCNHAKAIARREIGPSAQRLQPVVWRDDLSQEAFEEYARLPAMREAVVRLFSPHHRHCNTWHPNAPLGCLFEPTDEAWGTNWHVRNWHDTGIILYACIKLHSVFLFLSNHSVLRAGTATGATTTLRMPRVAWTRMGLAHACWTRGHMASRTRICFAKSIWRCCRTVHFG
jgi:hypothetical protein